MLKFSLINLIINSVKNLMFPCVRHASHDRSEDAPSEPPDATTSIEAPTTELLGVIAESPASELRAPRLSKSSLGAENTWSSDAVELVEEAKLEESRDVAR